MRMENGVGSKKKLLRLCGLMKYVKKIQHHFETYYGWRDRTQFILQKAFFTNKLIPSILLQSQLKDDGMIGFYPMTWQFNHTYW